MSSSGVSLSAISQRVRAISPRASVLPCSPLGAVFASPPALRQSLSPLLWWRRLPADAFRPADVPRLIRAMRDAGSIEHPQWPNALTGSANAAIEIAVKIAFRDELTALVDLALTAVLRCAVSGDVPAAVLIAAALRKRVAVDPRCRDLEGSWFVARCDDLDALWRSDQDCKHSENKRRRDRH
jgi:hypothetical protein